MSPQRASRNKTDIWVDLGLHARSQSFQLSPTLKQNSIPKKFMKVMNKLIEWKWQWKTLLEVFFPIEDKIEGNDECVKKH